MKLTVNFDTLKPIREDGNGNAYHKQVCLDKVSRILTEHHGKMVLLVNRLTNKAVPVIVLGNHYYYRSRAGNGRFIWMRHAMKPLFVNDHHRDLWDAFYFFVDFESMIRDNILNFGGDRIHIIGDGISLQLNP